MATTAASTHQILEDQLRSDCYALHASRAEVAELQSRHRDIECRYEYLRTVLSNMERSEENLRRTLAYETATSDAVINAARMGQPLPPALAADAATSVLCPPVHLSGKESHKSIFQTACEVEERRLLEKKELEGEIRDMEAVIAAEKRSIGALQHAMYAQAAWGDSLVKKRRRSQMTRAELLQEVEAAQKHTKSFAHDEEVLRLRIAANKQELAAKDRRLQEVQDFTRILSLQIEEVRSAVMSGKRDLLRAQTLDAECSQVARIASDKIQTIDERKNKAAIFASASSPWSAGQKELFAGVCAPGGDRREAASSQRPPQLPSSFPPQTGAQIGDGTHRYQQHQQQQRFAGGVGPSRSPISFSAATGAAIPHRRRSPPPSRDADKKIERSGGDDGTIFTASGSPQQQQQQRQSQLVQNYNDAKADANEWLRRYVGSLRGLHLTALETTSIFPVQQ